MLLVNWPEHIMDRTREMILKYGNCDNHWELF